jgi:hypothetical protein
MTRDPDNERVLDRWFTDGPTEMPDRLFNEVFDRIDRIPQRRLARLQTRFFAMNSNLRLAAAAVVALAVVGLGAFALSRLPATGTNPSASPIGSPNPSASSVSTLPAALRATWVGATRTIPQIAIAMPRAVLSLAADTMNFSGGASAPVLFSSAKLTSPDTLALTLSLGGNGCQSGDVGTYTFTLSGGDGGGGLMSLHAVTDPCAARMAAVSGDWYRSRCHDVNGWCFGDLAAGTYPSIFFNPWVAPQQWVSHLGALTYTVPAGWTSPEDCDGCFVLAQQGAPENTAIYLFDDIVPHSQDAACSEAAEPGVGRTVGAISAWLTSLPGLVASSPTPVSVGGLTGVSIDLTVDPNWAHTCSYSNGKALVSTFTDSDPGEGFDWNIGAGSKVRYILLDLGSDRTLLVDIEADTVAHWDDLIAGAMTVVNSFQFSR